MTRRNLDRARRQYNRLRRRLQPQGWATRLKRFDEARTIGYGAKGWGKRMRPLILVRYWDQSDGVWCEKHQEDMTLCPCLDEALAPEFSRWRSDKIRS